MTAKKKNPPGILDWIVDFLVGPIAKNIGLIPETLLELIPEFLPEPFKTEIDSALADVEAAIKTVEGKSPGLTLEEYHKGYGKLVDLVNKTAVTLLTATTALSAIPTVSLSDAIDEVWRLPTISGVMDMSTEIVKAAFDNAGKHFLSRYYLKEYTPLLPGYADMISIYVREGYLEEKWVELPAEFAEYMKELGYSEDWTKRLWGKHWVLPGVELLYDMFHKKIIDYETLALMLKFHDFEPVWRERLIKNAYAMIPRVDLRRAYMYRIPGYEDLVEPYEKLGYSPADAKTMDTIAKRFALTRYYTRLESVARAAFRKGRLTEDDLREILVKVNTPEAAIDLILEAENMARASAVREVAEEPSIPGRTDMRWLAEWGFIGLPELTALMEADGMDPEWAPVVAEAWMLNQLREELGKVRGVYEDLLEAGFMSKTDFEAALTGLHFAPHVVDALVMWADAKLDLDEKKELAKEYETLAKEEILTPTEYGNALRELGMTEERITRKQHHIELLLEIKAAKEAAKA